jgi:hypothetical protein
MADAFRRYALRRSSTGGRLAYVLLLAIVGYAAVLLAGGASLDQRVALLRVMTLLGAGLLAVAAPHLLFPDRRASLIQLLNPSSPSLLTYQLGRWGPAVGLALLPCALLAVFAPAAPWAEGVARLTYGMQALLVIGGTGLYSLAHYATLGATCQAWREGRRGQWYRRQRDEMGQGFAVPAAMVPAVLASARIFGLAVVVVVATVYVGRATTPGVGLALAATYAGWGAWRLLRLRRAYDRQFYQTNALYAETIGGDAQVEARSPMPYDALYWVPERWRPAAWASLRQLDRVLPLGRLVALGHLLLWILLAQGVPASVRAGYLLLLVLGPNAAAYALARPALAPSSWQLTMQSTADWVGTRFFVNLRWAPPLLASLLLVALFSDTFPWWAAVGWTGLYVAVAFVAALITTLLAEGTYRRSIA